MTTQPNIEKEHKWAAVFIEIALRAVRRVHYEYGLWGIGPQWEMNRPRASRINSGQGIELADELTVCAAITQEFVGSPALAGLWVDDEDQKQLRYFVVDRESQYMDCSKRVDLYVQKLIPKDNRLGGELERDGTPSFIEAKRAHAWTADTMTGEARCGSSNLTAVQSDVEKLRKEIQIRKSKEEKYHIRGHVLVWGVAGDGKGREHPVLFFNAVDGVKLHALRWMPLQWKQPSRSDLTNANLEIPKVEAALWIGLAEVVV